MTAEADPARCPACGRSNRCARAADAGAQHCWCFSTAIDPAALEALPPELRNRACLCPACASALPAEDDAP
jgi:hypothetical protein